MAVSINATGTTGTAVATTTGFTEGAATITVAAGSNTVLCLLLQTSADVSVSGFSVHWDSAGTNQLMTQVGTKIGESDNLAWCYIFGLIAPTTGAKLLHVAWTTTSADYTYCMIAFNGADQGSVSGTFQNFVSGNPASTTSVSYPAAGPILVNSPVGDWAVACAASNINGWVTTGGVGTNIYTNNVNVSGAGRQITGAGASTGLQFSDTNATANPACYAACDIAAVGTVAGGGPAPFPLLGQIWM